MEPAGAVLRAAVESRVVDRDGGLRREDLGELDDVRGERPGGVAIEHERAERVLAGEERHRQHRVIALGLDPAPRRLGEVDRRIVEDVRGPHGPPLRDRQGRGAVAPVERTHGLGELPAHPARRDEAQDGTAFVGLDDRKADARGMQQLGGLLDDPLQVRRR